MSCSFILWSRADFYLLYCYEQKKTCDHAWLDAVWLQPCRPEQSQGGIGR